MHTPPIPAVRHAAPCPSAHSRPVTLEHRSPVHAVVALPRALLHRLPGAGALESWWVPGGIFTLAVATAAGTVAIRRWLARRQRRRWPVTAAGVSFAVVLVLLAAAAGVNSYAGYLPTLSSLTGALPSTGPGDGTVVRTAFPAPAALHVQATTAYVYLPPGYWSAANATRRYPVVYLLAGNPGTAIDWFRAGEAAQTMNVLLRARVVRPMILVAPSTNDGAFEDFECANAVHGPQLETYLTSTVVHAVDERYRTVRARSARAIGGVSAGADCSLDLALRHLATFGIVVAHLPSGQPGAEALSVAFHGDRRLYDANAPIRYLPRMRFAHRLELYMDAGAQDAGDVSALRTLVRELQRDHQYVSARLVPNQTHTWREARAALPYSLDFASHVFYVGGAYDGTSTPAAVTAAACKAARDAILTHTRQQLATLHHVAPAARH